MTYFEWNIIHISKFKPGTVEKNSSTIGPLAGIEPTPLRYRCRVIAKGDARDVGHTISDSSKYLACIMFINIG